MVQRTSLVSSSLPSITTVPGGVVLASPSLARLKFFLFLDSECIYSADGVWGSPAFSSELESFSGRKFLSPEKGEIWVPSTDRR